MPDLGFFVGFFLIINILQNIIFPMVYKKQVKNNGNTENISVMIDHLVTWVPVRSVNVLLIPYLIAK